MRMIHEFEDNDEGKVNGEVSCVCSHWRFVTAHYLKTYHLPLLSVSFQSAALTERTQV